LTELVRVTQLFSPPAGGGAQLSLPYVGAFWKEDQIGERIIRMGGFTTNKSWAAVVTFMDGRWDGNNGDGVLLDKEMLDNTSLNGRGISFTSSMTPQDAENYKLSASSGSKMITGTTDGTGIIMFRAGLQTTGFVKATYTKSSKWDATDTPTYTGTSYPARYAVVTLYYNNLTKAMNLFLRQGGYADYLMRNGDYGAGYLNSASRPHAKRFSPYNLTIAAPLNRQIYLYGSSSGGVTASKFTDYPTQAGALFQFVSNSTANPNGLRYAWDASTNPKAHTGIISNTTWGDVPRSTGSIPPPPYPDYWTDPNTKLGVTNETCPPNYHRPTDGVTHTEELHNGPAVAASELRHSLFLNPLIGYASRQTPQWSHPLEVGGNTDNAVWGYYADGFFDRRQIVNGVGITPGTASSVSTGNVNIAHIGMLFYNDAPDSKASLFFPAAGERMNGTASVYSDAGNLELTGAQGSYWTSSAKQPNGYSMSIFNYVVCIEVNNPNRACGYSVRCVRN